MAQRVRTKPTKKQQYIDNYIAKNAPVMQLFGQLTSRVSLLSQMGTQYSGSRDLYQALGYPSEGNISWLDYYRRYLRQDMAKAIIDRPVKQSWKGELSIVESVSKEHDTEFEKSWKELFERLKLKSLFIRADKLTGIGQYSVILLGLNDCHTVEDFAKPVNGKRGLKLLYAKPISEYYSEIEQFDDNLASERYGLPLYYQVQTRARKTDMEYKDMSLRVHHSRVVHLVEDILEDEVYGTPRLQAVYNRLMDLEKLVGGDAEMFWRGARPGYTGKLDPDYEIGASGMQALESQIDEFEHNLRRILVNEGVSYEALAQQISDPSNHVDVQMQMISAKTGIPKRILTGSERGELSSAQDKLEWIAYVTSRREEQNEPNILRPFINKCIKIGVLPKPKTDDGKYKVVWDKLFSLSDIEKVNMGKARATALKEYSLSPYAQDLFPLELFAEFFLNMDDMQVERLMKAREDMEDSEHPLTEEERATLRGEDIDNPKASLTGDGQPDYGRVSMNSEDV